MDANFKQLIRYFPLGKLPFSLEKGSEHEFAMTNESLPMALLEELLSPHLAFELDEFSELMPGVHWRTGEGGYVLVFWAARLLRHSFYLFSYSPEGQWLDDAEVAGFFFEDGQMISRMANIEEPDSFHVVEAVIPDDSGIIDASTTIKWLIEIDHEGKFRQSDASEME
ncbi:MAG: hypothetical protein K1X68_13895 [Saprospiraceae bacterium]|nr:hypothetical protein [Saprospiraceae bacterium]HMW38893.1 hypothetical protein [Saprospiraceae bacterium]HMX86955.1 hypothetical protein [Saprospiraceae bacterium]HMZ39866.1 hypothetical protein [Saprospiraceae bacterium]HNA65568.1 hypothetical protein [Saprospiraceae bacterium]